MIDRLKPIKGYFKIELLDKNDKILSIYEDNNTVMARIPELYAGQACGFAKSQIDLYHINSIALGTAGYKLDNNNKEIPMDIDDRRTQLFSEDNFWNKLNDPNIHDKNRYVYQRTFDVKPKIDWGDNPTNPTDIESGTQGGTFPHINGIPDNYRQTPPTGNPDQDLIGDVNLVGKVITYNFTLGLDAISYQSTTPKPFSEAGLYMKLDSSPDGKPLGQLFAMKTFPPQYKNDTCSLKITWKLFF